MSEVIKPELELKLNSEHYDMVVTEDDEEDKIILQQFKGEMDTVYLVLNGSQVTVPIEILKTAVDAMHNLAQVELNKKELEQEKRRKKANDLYKEQVSSLLLNSNNIIKK